MSTNIPRRSAQVAALGFALSMAPAQKAQAYVGSYGAGALWLTTTGATTVGGIATTVLIVFLVIKTVDGGGGKPGDATRNLINGGLIATQGDLTMQLELLKDSPSAMAQAHAELTRGSGPSVDALTLATGLSASALQTAWLGSAAANGAPTDSAHAERFVMGFLEVIAPQLAVADDVNANFAWQLVRESANTEMGEAERAHESLAMWLDVPVADVAACSKTAMAAMAAADADAISRAAVYANPDLFLDTLAQTIEAQHSEHIQARIADIVENGELALQG